MVFLGTVAFFWTLVLWHYSVHQRSASWSAWVQSAVGFVGDTFVGHEIFQTFDELPCRIAENRTAENMINITINNKSANMMDHIDALASIEFGDNYCTYCTGNY